MHNNKRNNIIWLSIFFILLVGLSIGSHYLYRSLHPLHTFTSTHTRIYYIAADEVMWDYAPSKKNLITNKSFTQQEAIYALSGTKQIGSTYRKAIYRQYTDKTFKHLTVIPKSQLYLGLLGPTLHAEVGDTIKIYFKNNSTFPVSMHPHGVFYNKDSEGAGYNDKISGKANQGDSIPPGGQYMYVWYIPERAGPGPMDPSSIMWMYHSHVDEVKDTNTGLVGSIIVTRRGMARPDGTPKDVDKEFVTLFSIFNENTSWFLTDNIKTAIVNSHFVDTNDKNFQESNLKYSINGYIYGNMPMMTMIQGERVRWYVASMGGESDLHTPHWHGNTVLINGMRTDVAQVLPMGMVTADMIPDDPGIWLFHCHVNDHILAGMITRYKVLPNNKTHSLSFPIENTVMPNM
ncbi:MAG TPA: multicopper oxidase domain-containing protein [Candidatus Sulfotelmatobacter sp.]|jgi:FtsP/CotA-like multicopper oxidase with cupredoxin domain|nr:multicopper oxidase domain-containing protein [Candidatus Sulfotelmatobacter sp.]